MSSSFRVLVVNLTTGQSEPTTFGAVHDHLGGSGLAAALFEAFGDPSAPWDDPEQPLVFAIGPLSGFLPLMSKVVLGFLSPYHNQYAESHAGGRLALALRFSGYDALVIQGVAASPTLLTLGSREIRLLDAHYLWGMDTLATGKWVRKIHQGEGGHRSIVRIGPAGENLVAFAAINVDTYRHFGRLGCGAAMGRKRLKAILVSGDRSVAVPTSKAYATFYKTIYQEAVRSPIMRKYHDLGTPENVLPLNALRALPWRNLQATQDPGAQFISGEHFAQDRLLRQTACAGCPVGCIHIGLLRERFGEEHEYIYRQVSYDHEPIFAAGSMLGITDAAQVLRLLESMERFGLDAISAGVSLAWATEAFEKGLLSEKETLGPLRFGEAEAYDRALAHLAGGTNDFYRALGRGTLHAASLYGGQDFACVLGQEMAGYATGEVFFVSQAYGFRHSHLDSAGYSYDQNTGQKSVDEALAYLMEEERRRVQLTSMVACLFARKLYSEDRLQEALNLLGHEEAAHNLASLSEKVQAMRWHLRFRSGFDPDQVVLPKRFFELTTWKGPIDAAFLHDLAAAYGSAIRRIVNH
ncbi:aldehyde ferredoxin oxidoreductase N-terminal domain-containing protein [Desulfosoma caldarium]|uniref:Aldehyde:ferredoxin oxidoreductase n=1 Tax=Desulfosoma caldarium TaxID=610254 RepID=A0A3N1USR0_9BACT|nr:aldehyde ferredoxin oxidoreductase N-terminal domain-containing protein [Desulfosoma caldarium]ROQ93173.1 aldehyde:ferredoxin oxidoreductase [Desulfosoma caldarium]